MDGERLKSCADEILDQVLGNTSSLPIASFSLLLLSSEGTQGNPKPITFILREAGFRGAAGFFQEQHFEVEQCKPYGGGNSKSTE